ncbi:Hpt domain-containing protein [Vibrio cincinnatiensis]|uniref:quorum-sensing phosphorelay protein LuxU n=2 Tax=Vibrio cincinnatiensis TaxID=675 RepID=UPI001EDDC93F|nr:quorum-sensing phosphorelay protein LuxU [Vibrio cincinnatiensis]MCG3760476.1 Hpt domain-containing protein [Vibrio cincinnatiensis]MCG3763784.1 Hpt domain-containing protein [Vibrio cincinnatiensis]
MEWMNQYKIDRLSQEIGAENIPMLIEIFLGELEAYQKNLTSESVDSHLDYLAEISHALKSSAASFGADRLYAKAQMLDSLFKQGEAMDEATEVASMIDELNHTAKHYYRLINCSSMA